MRFKVISFCGIEYLVSILKIKKLLVFKTADQVGSDLEFLQSPASRIFLINIFVSF